MKQYGFRWARAVAAAGVRPAIARPRWLSAMYLTADEWARIVEPLLVGSWWGDEDPLARLIRRRYEAKLAAEDQHLEESAYP